MSKNPLKRFGRYLSSVFGVTAVCAASAAASAQPLPARVCHPASSVGDLALLSGCTEIAGDVRIERTTAENLDQLSALRHVRGTLVIADNPRLASLEGLSNLRSVDGLVVARNPALGSIDGLDRLERASRIEISNNRALYLVSGPDGLQRVDEIVVRGNGLYRLAGFRSLTAVGNVVIAKNPRLIYTSGLARLVTIENLTLLANPRLAPVGIFVGNAVKVRQDLIVKGCPGIRADDFGNAG